MTPAQRFEKAEQSLDKVFPLLPSVNQVHQQQLQAGVVTRAYHQAISRSLQL